jgi:hypothetical protein
MNQAIAYHQPVMFSAASGVAKTVAYLRTHPFEIDSFVFVGKALDRTALMHQCCVNI